MTAEKQPKFRQPGKVYVPEAVAEFFGFAGPQHPEFVMAIIANPAIHATDTPQPAIVKQHRHPVTGNLNIHFDETGARRDSGLDADQRVLGIVAGVTPVGDKLGDHHKSYFNIPGLKDIAADKLQQHARSALECRYRSNRFI